MVKAGLERKFNGKVCSRNGNLRALRHRFSREINFYEKKDVVGGREVADRGGRVEEDLDL
jgi:hypothetical protein